MIKKGIAILLCLLFSQTVLAERYTVLITGGMSGIGKEIATAFKEEGWNVWVTSREPEQYRKEQGIRSLKVNLKNDEEVQKAITRVQKDSGRIDVVVNNAGYGLLGPVETLTPEELQEQFEVNVLGSFRVIKHVLPLMRKQEHGHIINVSSISGVRAVPGLGGYAASKMALEGLTESLAAEVFPWNIKVSLVEPGSVNNNWAENATVARNAKSEMLYKELTSNLQGRLIYLSKSGQLPKDIGKIVVKIAHVSDPHFRYQTNEQSHEVVAGVYTDTTGDNMLNKMIGFARSLYKL